MNICKDCNKKDSCDMKEKCGNADAKITDCWLYGKVHSMASTNFSSRFMPNVKFKIADINYLPTHVFAAILAINKDRIYKSVYYSYETDKDGKIWNGHENIDLFNSVSKKEVSIYEAIPEILEGTGMRYSKEHDKLVPDILDEPNGNFTNITDVLKDIEKSGICTVKFYDGYFNNTIKSYKSFANGGIVKTPKKRLLGQYHSGDLPIPTDDFYSKVDNQVLLKNIVQNLKKANKKLVDDIEKSRIFKVTSFDGDWSEIHTYNRSLRSDEISFLFHNEVYCKGIANTDIHDSGVLDIYEDKKHSGFYYFNRDGVKTYIKRKSFINIPDCLAEQIQFSESINDGKKEYQEKYSMADDIQRGGVKEHFDNFNLKDDKDFYKNRLEERKKIDEDFIKYDYEKPMYDLVDPYAHEDLAKLLTFGAKKYDADNWKKGDIKTYISALERHLSDIKKAIDSGDLSLFTDKDSKLQHGAALMCNSMFIHHFIEKLLKNESI